MPPSSIRINMTNLSPEGKTVPFTLMLPRVTPGALTDACDQDPGRDYDVSILGTNLNDRYVFRCTLKGQQENDPPTVILKTGKARLGGDEAELIKREKEAVHYVQDLKELQGQEVPRFLGFYKGVAEGHGFSVACILLEDCGSPLWNGQLANYKIELGKALARFHLHSRLNYRNISAKNTLPMGDRLVLINFNKVTAHDCKFSAVIMGIEFSDIITQQLPDPCIERICCEEIYRFCIKMELFVPYAYEYMTTKFIIHSRIRSPEDLARMVLEVYDRPEEKECVVAWSRNTWFYIEDDLDKYARVPWAKLKDMRSRVKTEVSGE